MGSIAVHPSRFSPQVLEVMEPILLAWGWPVHDPFAGTGVRLGALCDRLGLPFTGTEIEYEFIIDPRVVEGNSRFADTYPEGRFCVATSVVYPNGMTDHFHARDDSRRKTYRQALAAIRAEQLLLNLEQADRPLHPDNMGRHGPRQGKLGAERHWAIAWDASEWWPSRVIVNIKDCILDHEVYPAVEKWLDILKRRGYQCTIHEVKTPGMRYGSNGQSRVDYEAIIEAYWRVRL